MRARIGQKTIKAFIGDSYKDYVLRCFYMTESSVELKSNMFNNFTEIEFNVQDTLIVESYSLHYTI